MIEVCQAVNETPIFTSHIPRRSLLLLPFSASPNRTIFSSGYEGLLTILGPTYVTTILSPLAGLLNSKDHLSFLWGKHSGASLTTRAIACRSRSPASATSCLSSGSIGQPPLSFGMFFPKVLDRLMRFRETPATASEACGERDRHLAGQARRSGRAQREHKAREMTSRHPE
jgi:hypothetical protein